MIAKLTGLVDHIGADHLVLDVGGVGYLVQASSRTLGNLPPVGEKIGLTIETVVREDAITLFGFSTHSELDMFRLLTSVQGVGAKVALAILSVLDSDTLQNAIAAQDKASVARANGVGPKLAARIVNELKDKVAGLALAPAGVAVPAGNTGSVKPSGMIADATSALVNLGYRPGDAHGVAARMAAELGDDATVEAIIPLALKELASA